MSIPTRVVTWPAEEQGEMPTMFEVPVTLRTHVQYRDGRDGMWKDARSSLTFDDICRINKIVGYEKYRMVRAWAPIEVREP